MAAHSLRAAAARTPLYTTTVIRCSLAPLSLCTCMVLYICTTDYCIQSQLHRSIQAMTTWSWLYIDKLFLQPMQRFHMIRDPVRHVLTDKWPHTIRPNPGRIDAVQKTSWWSDFVSETNLAHTFPLSPSSQLLQSYTLSIDWIRYTSGMWTDELWIHASCYNTFCYEIIPCSCATLILTAWSFVD